jgi:DNA-binding response OmpR family regulator
MESVLTTLIAGSAAPDVSKCQILLVDDHADSRRAYVRLLQNAGFIVIEAEKMAGAFELAHSMHFELLLSDLELTDGWAWVLPQYIEFVQGKHVPSIAVSAHCYERHVAKALASGFDSYLAKPHTIEELLAVIAKHTRTTR